MTDDLERWQMGDPFEILARKQARERRRRARSKQGQSEKARQALENLFAEDRMTQDESEQVERLLITWYTYEASYRPALGAPRVSPSCRGYDSGDIHDDGDDRDARIDRVVAEGVSACMDELDLLHRIAIQTHMRNLGQAVYRNPRLGTPEQAHQMYLDAKSALWPKLRGKGLVR